MDATQGGGGVGVVGVANKQQQTNSSTTTTARWWWWPPRSRSLATRRGLPAVCVVAAAVAAAAVVLTANDGPWWGHSPDGMPAALFFDDGAPGDWDPRSNITADHLLDGLLTADFTYGSCRSRYEFAGYNKESSHKPSPYLIAKLRKQEALQKRCGPGTAAYKEAVRRLDSGEGVVDDGCRYLVYISYRGLGNRMLAITSSFLYAVLTERVLLVDGGSDAADLFCEPFPGTTWLLPLEDFPVANLFGLGHNPEQSYTRLLNRKKIVVDGDDNPASNATAAAPVPAYVYLSLGFQLTDRLFFCGEHQLALGKVKWLLLYSDLYFVPSLYPVAGFRDELRRLFPAKESASHLLLRYLLHPTNPVWGLVTRY